MVIIYSWLLQPYGVVSQKGLTFLRFEPSSLQSAIPLLSLLAMEGVNQTVYSYKKKLYFWDLNLQPYNLQSSSLTSEPWKSLVRLSWQFYAFETPTCQFLSYLFHHFLQFGEACLEKLQAQSKSINWTYPMIEVSSTKNLVGWSSYPFFQAST